MKRRKIAKYGVINDVLYKWYIKCCQVGIYPDGAMLQEEEALKIKTELNDSNLGNFKASNEWLEDFKKHFGLRQTRIVGEAGDVPITIMKAWMERLPEIIQGYSAMASGTWMNQGFFLKLFQILGQQKELKSLKTVRNQKSDLL